MASDDLLTPKCGECGVELTTSGPMCIHVERELPGMGLHHAQTLARRIFRLEAQIAILVAREEERRYKRKPRAAKRAERAS